MGEGLPHSDVKWVFCLLALGGVLLSGCQQRTISPQTLVIGVESNPVTLDPRFATDALSERIGQLLYNRLVRLTDASEIVPDLAERWDHPSPTLYVFHLKKGVLFHDGTECTADDVAYTFRSILDPAMASPHRKTYEVISRIDVVDRYTVRFVLSRPHAPFLVNMVRGILPRHAAEQAGKEFGLHPIGTGPYQFVRWVPDEKIELAAHGGSFEGRPALESIILKIVPDETVRLLELQKGTIQLVQNALPPESLPLFMKRPEFAVAVREGTTFAYLGLNLQDPVLSDIRVRRAIAYAIDREMLIRHLLSGLARPATGLLPETHWAYEPRVTTYSHDPDKARQFLEEAGYSASGPPAGRTGTGRHGLRLTFKTSTAEMSRRLAEALQRQLSEAGIEVTIRSYEWGTFYADIKAGNFQMFGLQWVGITDPDIYGEVFHSGSIPPAGANRGRYTNPEVDRLVEEGRRTEDVRKRKALYSRVQQIIATDLPYISLWHLTNVAVMRKEVKGFVPSPSGDWTSLKGVWIEPPPVPSPHTGEGK